MDLRDELHRDEFKLFTRFIESACGISIDESRSEALSTSLLQRMVVLGFEDYLSYYYFLKNNVRGDEEFGELVKLITINETSFFRYAAQFEAIRDEVIPELIRAKQEDDRMLRFWSAGCASGEEPYSLAMVFNELDLAEQGWQIKILGTDIDRSVLDLAKKGVYSRRSMQQMDEFMIKKYFTQIGEDEWLLHHNVRNMVGFAESNLSRQPYPPWLSASGWDIIMCRNVLIYFQEETIRKILDEFWHCLGGGGYLFVGHSENLAMMPHDFETMRFNEAFYYRKAKVKTKPKAIRELKLAQEPSQPRIEVVPMAKELVGDIAQDLITLDEAIAEDRADEALEISEQIINVDPANIPVRLKRAEILTNRSCFEQAVGECEAALDQEPFLAEAHFILGICWINLGKRDRAVEQLKKTVFIDRDHALAYFYLANLYLEIGDQGKAANEYHRTLRALERSPEGDWQAFAGGYSAEVLYETANNAIKKLIVKAQIAK